MWMHGKILLRWLNLVKEKILFVLPALPGVDSHMRDRRLFCMLKSLIEQYEIHVLYSQTLSNTAASIEALHALGLTVMSVHELAKHSAYTFDKQIATLMGEHEYQSIYFHSIYSARYYLPFLVLSSVNVRIIIDGGKARYIDEKIRANDPKTSPVARAVANKQFRIARLPEIAIYRHADVIIVPDALCLDVVKSSLPDRQVQVIADMRTEADIETISRETRAAFDAVAADSGSYYRAGKGWCDRPGI
jgi:hypothetical protein